MRLALMNIKTTLSLETKLTESLEERQKGTRQDSKCYSCSSKRDAESVLGQEGFLHERHEGTRDTGCAAENAVRHSTSRDPVLIDHAQDGVVEDEEAEAVCHALSEDEHFQTGSKRPQYEPKDADRP